MKIPVAKGIFHAIPQQSAQLSTSFPGFFGNEVAQLFHAMPQKIQWTTQLMRQTRTARWEGLVLYRRIYQGFNSCILTGCVFMARIIIILTNQSTLKNSSLRSVLHSDG